MAAQMIVRIEPGLKGRLDALARAEGRTTSDVVREMVTEYVRQRDTSAYVADLWERIGAKLKARGVGPGDVRRATAAVRRDAR